jgi:hypothetical protein
MTRSPAAHGMSYSPEYRAWQAMRQRCLNSKCESYKDYGARGIAICDRWSSFQSFYSDMGPRPSPKHSIDRRDNDGNYEPSNCTWSTKVRQSNNRRDNRRVAFNGRTQACADWAREIGIKPATLYDRLFVYGWPVEKAMTPKYFPSRWH